MGSGLEPLGLIVLSPGPGLHKPPNGDAVT